jgi:hypothetical protein
MLRQKIQDAPLDNYKTTKIQYKFDLFLACQIKPILRIHRL